MSDSHDPDTVNVHKSEDEFSQPESTASRYWKGKRKAKNMYHGRRNKQKGDGDGDGSQNTVNEKKKNSRRKVDFNDSELKPPNPGSYASVAMQERFHVTLGRPNQLTASVVAATQSDDQKETTSINHTSSDNQEESTQSRRNPKRKVAILIAFVGQDYKGFQMNPGTKSIQAEIEVALYEAGLLSVTNFGYPQKYSWSSSARTDKGVHACAQVCSCKLEIPPHLANMDNVRIAVNEKLPPAIKVLDIIRTTRAFCAHTQRSKVRYQYMLPSFVLYDRDKLRECFKKHKCHRTDRHYSDPLSPENVQLLQKELTKYRAPKGKVEKLRTALGAYVGTHLFHNFTSGKTSDEANSRRYILDWVVQDPVVLDGTEWITTQITGQSFLLHQIRKMVSMAFDVARGATGPDTIEKAFHPDQQMRLNVAPAQGLFLDMSYFDAYNKKKNNVPELNWACEQITPAMERWKEFKESIVMPHIVREEACDGNFIKYLFTQEYVFDFESHYQEKPEGKEEANT